MWSVDLAGPVTSVAVDAVSDGTLMVGGSFTGNIDLGGDVLTSAGEEGVFVGAFDP